MTAYGKIPGPDFIGETGNGFDLNLANVDLKDGIFDEQIQIHLLSTETSTGSNLKGFVADRATDLILAATMLGGVAVAAEHPKEKSVAITAVIIGTAAKLTMGAVSADRRLQRRKNSNPHTLNNQPATNFSPAEFKAAFGIGYSPSVTHVEECEISSTLDV